MMSNEARTVLVVTDDPFFPADISRLVEPAEGQTLRFTHSHEAPKLAHALLPDLVLIHIAQGCLEAGWAGYHQLEADAALAATPLLFYSPPRVLA